MMHSTHTPNASGRCCPGTPTVRHGAAKSIRSVHPAARPILPSLGRSALARRVGGLDSCRVRATVFEKDEAANAMLVNPIGEISGLVKLPGSKSLSNRVLLLAALASGTTVVENILDSEDIRYMVSALKTLQVRVWW